MSKRDPCLKHPSKLSKKEALDCCKTLSLETKNKKGKETKQACVLSIKKKKEELVPKKVSYKSLILEGLHSHRNVLTLQGIRKYIRANSNFREETINKRSKDALDKLIEEGKVIPHENKYYLSVEESRKRSPKRITKRKETGKKKTLGSEGSSKKKKATSTKKKAKKTSKKAKPPTPKQKTPTPKQRTPTPKQKTPTPKQKTPTPKQKTPSPKQKTPSPKQIVVPKIMTKKKILQKYYDVVHFYRTQIIQMLRERFSSASFPGIMQELEEQYENYGVPGVSADDFISLVLDILISEKIVYVVNEGYGEIYRATKKFSVWSLVEIRPGIEVPYVYMGEYDIEVLSRLPVLRNLERTLAQTMDYDIRNQRLVYTDETKDKAYKSFRQLSDKWGDDESAWRAFFESGLPFLSEGYTSVDDLVVC